MDVIPYKRHIRFEENSSAEKKQKIAMHLEDFSTTIRTIEVGNIPDDVCSEYLRGYFEHAAGPVTNVSIVEKIEENRVKRVGYVTFLIPEDAARLICDANLQFNLKFTIKQAERMYQPNTFFEDINDDCFFHIISYLSLFDIINLSKTSTRLQSVTDQIFEEKSYFSFDAKESCFSFDKQKSHFSFDEQDHNYSFDVSKSIRNCCINRFDVPVILKVIGKSIRSLDWLGLNCDSLAYLSQYCPNVTMIKLRYPSADVRSYSIKGNKQFFEKLEVLEILSASWFDVTFKSIISYSQNLKSLRLRKCHNLRGKFIDRLKNSKLKHFKVQKSEKVNSEVINNLTSLSELTELELDYFSSDELKVIPFKDFKQLKKFTLTRQNDYNCNNLISALSKVTTLESLTIKTIQIDDDTVKCLALFKNLKQLMLDKITTTIEKQLYSSICVHLPKLTDLSLYLENETFEEKNLWIRDMIASLHFLEYFCHNSLTWKLLDMILQVQIPRRSILKIRLPKTLFWDPFYTLTSLLSD